VGPSTPKAYFPLANTHSDQNRRSRSVQTLHQKDWNRVQDFGSMAEIAIVRVSGGNIPSSSAKSKVV